MIRNGEAVAGEVVLADEGDRRARGAIDERAKATEGSAPFVALAVKLVPVICEEIVP